MTKNKLIKQLLPYTSFKLTLHTNMQETFTANIASTCVTLETIREHGDLDHMTDLGLDLSTMYDDAINKTLREFAFKCPICGGWFLTKDEVYNVYEDEIWCQDCFDNRNDVDYMTVAHAAKEEA